MNKILLGLFGATLTLSVPAFAGEQAPFKIGSVFEYSVAVKWGQGLDKGQALAVDEINAAGGVKGRKLEIVRRDNKEDVGETVRVAEELALRDKVDLFVGTVSSNTSLALSEWAHQNNKIFVVNAACTDELVYKNGNATTFKIHPLCTSLGKMLAQDAAKIPAKRWGYVGFISDYSTSVYQEFKKRLAELRPDVVWVSYQEQPFGKLDAGSAINKMKADKVDAVLDLLVVTDQSKFLRKGNVTGFFKQVKTVVSPNFGLPEEHEGIPATDLPQGWITGGYPSEEMTDPAQQAFVSAFKARYGGVPDHSSFIGYVTIKTIAAALERAKDSSTASLQSALEGVEVATPAGPVSMRQIDHQSTLGFWIGTTAVQNGAFKLLNWHYEAGDAYLPTDAWIHAHRPAEKAAK